MEIVGKILIGCMAAIFLAVTGVSVVLGNTDETNANHYLDSVSKVVIESNYNPGVIAECCTDAEERGYVLQIEVYGNDKPGAKKYAQVKLTYTYSMNLFRYEKQKTLEKIV